MSYQPTTSAILSSLAKNFPSQAPPPVTSASVAAPAQPYYGHPYILNDIEDPANARFLELTGLRRFTQSSLVKLVSHKGKLVPHIINTVL